MILRETQNRDDCNGKRHPLNVYGFDHSATNGDEHKLKLLCKLSKHNNINKKGKIQNNISCLLEN